jgi:hypothetical protein
MEHASYLFCIFLFLPGAMKSPPGLGEALFFCSFFLSFLCTLFDFQLFSVGGGVVLSLSSSSSFLYPFRKLVLPDPA